MPRAMARRALTKGVLVSTPPRAVVVLGLLVLMVGFGITAVSAVPDGGHGIGIWPVALGTATLMVSRRPPTWVLMPGLAVLATASMWIGGRRQASPWGSAWDWRPRCG